MLKKAIIILLIGLALFGCTQLPPGPNDGNSTITPTANPSIVAGSISSNALKSFKSFDEITQFLEAAQYSSGSYYGGGMRTAGALTESIAAPQAAVSSDIAVKSSGETTANAPSYSTTNVQVEGVDEADIVKSDGKYIYALSQNNNNIAILDAYPASEMKAIGSISSDGDNLRDIFINNDKLIVFGTKSINWDEYPCLNAQGLNQAGCIIAQSAKKIASGEIMPRYYGSSSFAKVYDVSDKTSPKLLKTIEVKGNYQESRMIGNKVYSVITDYANSEYPQPLYAVNSKLQTITASEVNYFDYPDYGYAFTIVVGFDLSDLSKEENKEIVLMGSSQTLFVSQNNAYVTYTDYTQYTQTWDYFKQTMFIEMPQDIKEKIDAADESDLPSWLKDRIKVSIATKYLQTIQEKLSKQMQDEIKKLGTSTQNTVIHKFSLGDTIAYKGVGRVPGTVLNQFSMDEYNGFLRVATTQTDYIADEGRKQASNVFILDSEMKTVGSIRAIAPGEQIYSARFMGDKAYLVTFKRTDPFFVIDLKDPANPKILGELKIPGYSDYLHPYDENHVIGLGKGADEQGMYQGVKLSLFDVSDLNNPREVAKYEIGDRGTDSYALNDHKAFLFDKEKNLLVIPITLAIIDKSKVDVDQSPWTWGETKFRGAYVFNLSVETGFTLRARISHEQETTSYKWNRDIQRSLYIGDSLYTLSSQFVKAYSLLDLSQEAIVDLTQVGILPVITLQPTPIASIAPTSIPTQEPTATPSVTVEPTIIPTPTCFAEGEELGAVIPENANNTCCEGLVPVIPEEVVGTMGICQKPNATASVEPSPTATPQPSATIEPLPAEVLALALNSSCTSEGNLTESFYYNNYSNVWRISMQVNASDCAADCVVSVENQSAEIGWMCTGALPE